MTLAPGEALDPLNDMVEQLSNVMMLSVVALGVQKALLSILAKPLVMTLLGLIVIGVGTLYQFGSDQSRRFAARALLFVLLFRVGLPLIPATTIFTSRELLGMNEATDTTELSNFETKIGARDESAENSTSWWSVSTSPMEAAKAKFVQYQAIAEGAAEKCTNLMVLFLIETIGLPLLIFYLGKTGIRFVVGRVVG